MACSCECDEGFDGEFCDHATSNGGFDTITGSSSSNVGTVTGACSDRQYSRCLTCYCHHCRPSACICKAESFHKR